MPDEPVLGLARAGRAGTSPAIAVWLDHAATEQQLNEGTAPSANRVRQAGQNAVQPGRSLGPVAAVEVHVCV